MADRLELATEGHGGLRRWEQFTRFRVGSSITGVIWSEDGPSWRALLVTYPDTIVARIRQQTYYFQHSRLLRRMDYFA